MGGWLKYLAVVGVVSVMLTASTQAQTVPADPASAKAAPQTPIPAAALPQPQPDPALADPDTDTTRRVGGYAGDQALGGADCRTQCDRAYYLCLAVDDSGQCPTTWTQCLTACPSHSSNF
jgi:hypothetical protein